MRQQAIRSIRDDMCFVLNEENEQVVGGKLANQVLCTTWDYLSKTTLPVNAPWILVHYLFISALRNCQIFWTFSCTCPSIISTVHQEKMTIHPIAKRFRYLNYRYKSALFWEVRLLQLSLNQDHPPISLYFGRSVTFLT